MKNNILLVFLMSVIGVNSQSIDTDKDGVLNEVDKCPTDIGVKENEGCPWGDMDNDGVLDNIDKCPAIKGSASSHGCRAVVCYFSPFPRTIYFDSGEIELYLNTCPDKYILKGYTDNIEALESRKLAKKRAKVVKHYLISKGVSARLLVIDSGKDDSVTDNREQNRCVKFIFMRKK